MESPELPPKKEVNPHRPNLWGFMRDIILAAMNKGQLPALIVGIILAIAVYRMPSGDITKFLFECIGFLKSHSAIGYILFIITFIYAISNVKKLRTAQKLEIDKLHRDMVDLRKQIN